ncbi:hypothetical protein FGIG_04626 [Fasciola gigantica]|uniref:DEP domain-containing protein n=1 Tax=Fasciola gigantica TaxID=46835 RepID=A0A504Z1G5_FASGI|nr:hypothetical protein FGIG_04626 [Fasciola gigantica]
MNRRLPDTRFPHKERLHRCLQEWRKSVPNAFRLSEASKWLESYFRREGGNVSTISVFLEFVKNLGLITIVEQNMLASKFYFCDEKINEIFGDTRSFILKDSRVRNDDRLPRQRTQPEFGTQPKVSQTPSVFSTDLLECENWNHVDAQTWFEELITRIACLLDTNRDELVGYLQSPDSDIMCYTKTGASTVNCLGSAAHFNCTVLCRRRNSECSALERVVDAVCLACFDHLARWPNECDHKPELCGGLCAPNQMLSTALKLAHFPPEHRIPRVVEMLLELIFRVWPPCDFTSTVKKLSTNTTECPSNLTTIDSPCTARTPAGPTKALRSNNALKSRRKSDSVTPFLPPLATPVVDHNIPFVDDSRFLSCRPTDKRKLLPSQIRSLELNDSSLGDYQPISPIVQRCSASVAVAGESREDYSSSCQLNFTQNPVMVSRYGIDRLIDDVSAMGIRSDVFIGDPEEPGELRASVTKPRSDSHSVDQHGTGPGADNDLSDWPSARSHELTLAAHIALLFLPPFLYARLRVLTDALQRVLSNHSNLAAVLKNANDTAGAVEDTFGRTLDLIAPLSAPALFSQSDRIPFGSFGCYGTNWRESLTRLLLCDTTGSMFCTPANLVKQCASAVDVNFGTRSTANKLVAWCDPWARSTDIQPFVSSSDAAIDEANCDVVLTIPLCLGSVAAASQQGRVLGRPPRSGEPAGRTFFNTDKNRLASTPMPAGDQLSFSPYRSHSTECFLTEFGSNSNNEAFRDRACSTQLPYNEALDTSSTTAYWCTSSYNSTGDTLTSLYPKRLASLGNTAHLIKLLNQIINDRQMEPRRKMKWLSDFRKAHPDVYWRRFHDQQTSAAYLERLQRRIDAQAQPSVLERITNALRLRRQSRSRVRQQSSVSESPPRSAPL